MSEEQKDLEQAIEEVGGIAEGASDTRSHAIEGLADVAGLTVEELKDAVAENDPLGIVNPRAEGEGE